MNLKYLLVAGLMLSGSVVTTSAMAADEAVENPITEDGIVKVRFLKSIKKKPRICEAFLL